MPKCKGVYSLEEYFNFNWKMNVALSWYIILIPVISNLSIYLDLFFVYIIYVLGLTIITFL
jgi:hypothetical protein